MTTPPTPPAPHGSHDPDALLANRAALLTVVALLGMLVGAVAIPLTFQETEATAARVLASAPAAVGVGAGMLARGARTRLRALREREEHGTLLHG
jgi:hypothetical protein